MKFYKRDPDRALAGMAELTLKQRGAYNSLLDLLYSRDGAVPDDDARVSRMISCHWREWATTKAELIAMGKVWVEDGNLHAKRVQDTIKEASDFAQEQSKRASKRWTKWEKPNGNKGRSMPVGNALTPTATPNNKGWIFLDRIKDDELWKRCEVLEGYEQPLMVQRHEFPEEIVNKAREGE